MHLQHEGFARWEVAARQEGDGPWQFIGVSPLSIALGRLQRDNATAKQWVFRSDGLQAMHSRSLRKQAKVLGAGHNYSRCKQFWAMSKQQGQRRAANPSSRPMASPKLFPEHSSILSMCCKNTVTCGMAPVIGVNDAPALKNYGLRIACFGCNRRRQGQRRHWLLTPGLS